VQVRISEIIVETLRFAQGGMLRNEDRYMNKRLKLQCWNCPKTYFATVETSNEQKVIVRCSYCNAEAVVDLRPYHKQSKPVTVFRGENKDAQGDEEFQFPDVVPTRKPE
jgi:hypothetical protein